MRHVLAAGTNADSIATETIFWILAVLAVGAARAMIRELNGPAARRSKQGSIQEFRLASDDVDDLTLGLLRALRSADVVAHDAALPVAILEYARRDARQVILGETEDVVPERADGMRVIVLRAAQSGTRNAAAAKR